MRLPFRLLLASVAVASASAANAASPEVTLLPRANTSSTLISASFAGGGTVVVDKGGGSSAIFIPPYSGQAVLKLSPGETDGSVVYTAKEELVLANDAAFGASQFSARFTLRPGRSSSFGSTHTELYTWVSDAAHRSPRAFADVETSPADALLCVFSVLNDASLPPHTSCTHLPAPSGIQGRSQCMYRHVVRGM